jgi:hypothetical protein
MFILRSLVRISPSSSPWSQLIIKKSVVVDITFCRTYSYLLWNIIIRHNRTSIPSFSGLIVLPLYSGLPRAEQVSDILMCYVGAIN